MERVLITGGTGLVGKALTKVLIAKGYEVLLFTRKPPGVVQGPVRLIHWDPDTGTIDGEQLRKADHIIHLAGAGLADKRWTKARKKEIMGSRVNSGRLLAQTLAADFGNVKTFVSASGVAWYGADPKIRYSEPFQEGAPPASDFLGRLCYEWEAALDPLRETTLRKVVLRTGVVLSNQGGILTALKRPVQLGFATLMGQGRQIMSWIHIDDLVHLYLQAIRKSNYSGVYNAVAPEPVSNRRFMTTLAEVLKGKFFTRMMVPSRLLRLALGELGGELLKSTTASSKKLTDNGFVFRYPDIQTALKQLLASPVT
ncbi:TIGR01777 family oxidoreductase [Niabella terrae]